MCVCVCAFLYMSVCVHVCICVCVCMHMCVWVCVCFNFIAQCTHNGGPSCINLEFDIDALKDESAYLTCTALVGQQKQSVQHTE